MSHNPSDSIVKTSQQRLIKKIRIELGSICLKALENPNVIEIMLNSDGTLWIEELGKPIIHVGSMQESKVKALLGTIASYLNTTITASNPILECELPLDGSRFESQLSPLEKKLLKYLPLKSIINKKYFPKNNIIKLKNPFIILKI